MNVTYNCDTNSKYEVRIGGITLGNVITIFHVNSVPRIWVILVQVNIEHSHSVYTFLTIRKQP